MRTRKSIYHAAPVSIDALLSRQSVRTTFKLAPEVIELLSIISGQLGIKQKSLLDQLIEDTDTLHLLAKQKGESSSRTREKNQKTFVVSRSTLNAINTIARKVNIPRDELVERSIRRLLPLARSEREKHNRRKEILNAMKKEVGNREHLLKRAQEMLGKDDDLCTLIHKELDLARKHLVDAEAIAHRGMIMEDWDAEILEDTSHDGHEARGDKRPQ